MAVVPMKKVRFSSPYLIKTAGKSIKYLPRQFRPNQALIEIIERHRKTKGDVLQPTGRFFQILSFQPGSRVLPLMLFPHRCPIMRHLIVDSGREGVSHK
jgi:hypothetical protein